MFYNASIDGFINDTNLDLLTIPTVGTRFQKIYKARVKPMPKNHMAPPIGGVAVLEPAPRGIIVFWLWSKWHCWFLAVVLTMAKKQG